MNLFSNSITHSAPHQSAVRVVRVAKTARERIVVFFFCYSWKRKPTVSRCGSYILYIYILSLRLLRDDATLNMFAEYTQTNVSREREIIFHEFYCQVAR